MEPSPIPSTVAAPVADTQARPLRDLRVSVTDRCNFRCRYCMPREVFGPGFAFLDREELLCFEEITRLVAVFVELGVRKVRLTGGEPLLRNGLPELVRQLAAIDAIEDLALTTNGSLLRRDADALAAAGLGRLTISLDALDQPTFAALSDTRVPLTQVLDGIEAARAAGFAPLKLNAVIRRGHNEHAIGDLAGYARDEGHTVRFIEYMDVGSSNGWRMDDVVSADEIIARIGARWPLEPVETVAGAVAERYRYTDGAGEIGVVASVTKPFCRTCVRARLSAVGELFTCLFATTGHDLRAAIRGGASDDELRQRLASLWRVRDDRYSEQRTAGTAPDGDRVEMSYIGG